LIQKNKNVTSEGYGENYYIATQWQLMGRKFRKHKLAVLCCVILAVLYLTGLFCEFVSPYDPVKTNSTCLYSPPQKIHFFDGTKFHLRPFVYGINLEIDRETLKKIYTEDKSEIYPISLFIKGDPYKFWNLFKTDIHLFGVDEPGVIYLFGTDDFGRDMLSRIIYASRISLSIGLIGVLFSFILGTILGGISGFVGGAVDNVIQRIIEFLITIPSIPLWMAFSAALPVEWPSVLIYFFITIILSLLGWCGLARVIRGKILELREEDFVMAAKISGASTGIIIKRHLLPSTMSYLIVHLTLAIPNMILGETALSFLGLGIRPPAISWGTLLEAAQNFRSVANYPWLLIPCIFVIITVLAFNFVGDGLRDAADPYK